MPNWGFDWPFENKLSGGIKQKMEVMNMNSNIGRKGTDKMTGIIGVITGRCEYLYGCTQYHIQPKAKDNSNVDGFWVDEGRVEIGEVVFKPSDVAGGRPGGPSQGPAQGNLRS